MHNAFRLWAGSLLCLSLFSGCFSDEIPDLEPSNPLEVEQALVGMTDYTYIPSSFALRIEYELLYDFAGDERIRGIAIYRDGDFRGVITNLDQGYFYEGNLASNRTYCYQLGIMTTEEYVFGWSDIACYDTP